MPKTPTQQVGYFLYTLKRLRNYVAFSENGWEQYLAEYDRSLTDHALNVAKLVVSVIIGPTLPRFSLSTIGEHLS